MNGEKKKRKGGIGLWIILAGVLFNAVAEGEPIFLIMLMPLIIIVVVFLYAKKKAMENASNIEAGTVGAKPRAPSLWQQVRNEQEKRFDEQRERQSGDVKKAMSGSSRIYSNPIGRINNEDNMRKREELVDLLNAGIIERDEFNERMDDLK